jgi:hypothetical protein
MVAFGSSKGGAKRGRVKWLSVLMGVGILLITGTVVADVVLTYVVNNQLGSTGTSPFVFVEGSNYALASSYGLATSTFFGGTGAGGGSSVSTSISGLNQVNVELINVTTFAQNLSIGATATAAIGGIQLFGTPVLPASGLVCAYAVLTTYVPASSGALLPGEASGAGNQCLAFAPYAVAGTTSTHLGQGCKAAVGDVINLATGAFMDGITAATTSSVTFAATTGDQIVNTCAITGPGVLMPSVNSEVLFLSYAIYTNSGITGGPYTLESFTVPVAIS